MRSVRSGDRWHRCCFVKRRSLNACCSFDIAWRGHREERAESSSRLLKGSFILRRRPGDGVNALIALESRSNPALFAVEAGDVELSCAGDE